MDSQESILTDIEDPEAEASNAQRILANIIDFVLELVLLVLFYWIMPDQLRDFLIRNKPVSTYVVIFLWFTLYRLLTILLLQRTIGMILCRCKYLNENLQPLSLKEKLIATIATRTKKIKLYKA